MGVKVRANRAAISARITGTFNKVLNNKQMLTEIGEFAAKRMKGQLRTGKEPDGTRFKSLSPKTVEQRQRLEKFNRTGSFYSPRKSNLTFTGQLGDSIKIREIRKGRVSVGPVGRRRSLRTGPQSSARKTRFNTRNEILGAELNKERRFIGIDNKGQRTIKNIVLRVLRRALRVARRR